VRRKYGLFETIYLKNRELSKYIFPFVGNMGVVGFDLWFMPWPAPIRLPSGKPIWGF